MNEDEKKLKYLRGKARQEFVTNPKPGAWLGIPAEEYHAAAAVNNSTLKRILDSPAHMQAPRADSPALLKGRLYHELALTPRKFKKNWAVFEGAARRGKAWEEFQAEHAGKEFCTVKEHGEAKGIAKAARRAFKDEYLSGQGANEVTLVWEEEIDGMPLKFKCRLDRLETGVDGGRILDLKGTGGSCTKEAFAREAAKYRYEMQVAWYLRGVEMALGWNLCAHEFVFLVVEKTEPHICADYYLSADAVHHGRMAMDHALRKYVECSRANHWPRPNNGRAEELTNYFPRDFEGAQGLDFGELAVEPMEVAA